MPMRYFFHLKDGIEVHEEEGMELNGMDDVKNEAFQASVDMLRGRSRRSFLDRRVASLGDGSAGRQGQYGPYGTPACG
jgi:BMFP domain-containing protein YqiC